MENQNADAPKPERTTAKEKAAMAALYTGVAVGGLGAGWLVRQAFYTAAAIAYVGVREGMRLFVTGR